MKKTTDELSIESIRSTEVQEIVAEIPSSIVRWGMTVIFLVMTIALIISWFIQYPDILQAKVIITTSTPPSVLVSRKNGNIKVLKKEKDLVQKGTVIAYFESNTDPATVLNLEQALLNNVPFKILDSEVKALGELEGDYASFKNSTLEFQLFSESNTFKIQIDQLNRQHKTYLRLDKNLILQKELAKKEEILAHERYYMDSILYAQKINAPVEFNTSQAEWIEQQRNYVNAEASLVNNEIQLNEISKQISDLEIRKIDFLQKLTLNAIGSKKILLAHISQWKESNLFTAPQEGRIANFGFKEDGVYIEAGKPYASILPLNETLIALAELPLYNSGKVQEGQKVNILLESYPPERYGSIAGIVTSISAIPNEGKYAVKIALPNKLRTTEGKNIDFKQQLSGTTEIITEELTLFERFFYQFR